MQQALDKLNTLPEPTWQWSLGKDTALINLGFSKDDVADLIAIANFEHVPDDPRHEISDTEVIAATHAYRALAELRDPAHLDIFLNLIKDPEASEDDLFNEDMITILSHYGEAAVEPCLAAIEEHSSNEISRLIYVEILEKIASNGHGKTEIIKRFSAYLNAKHFTRSLNACVIATLITLKADTEIDAIRACYEAHLVEITMNGDLEEVECDLGLRDSRNSDTHPSWSELEERSLHQAVKADLGPRPENDVELFCYLFDLYSRECSAIGLSGMHATLTAAVLAPRMVKPSECFAYIWDTDNINDPYTPVWENKKDAEFFMQFLMAMYNQIIESLNNGTFEPIPDVHQDNPEFLSYYPWLLSLNRSLGKWHSVSSPENLSEDYIQIISHTTEIIKEETFAGQDGTLPDTKAEINQLSKLLSRIYKENKSSSAHFFSTDYAAEQYTREAPKISRNAPCPCGSGKKYKRCCLN